MNVQHLESLYDVVEKTVRVKVRERLPDSILAEADQIVNVDLTPEDLQERLRKARFIRRNGYRPPLITFSKTPNLENLRELTLREMAAQIDLRRHETLPEDGAIVPDQDNGLSQFPWSIVKCCLGMPRDWRKAQPELVCSLRTDSFRRCCRNRQPDTAAVVGSADTGEGTGRHGLYLQGEDVAARFCALPGNIRSATL